MRSPASLPVFNAQSTVHMYTSKYAPINVFLLYSAATSCICSSCQVLVLQLVVALVVLVHVVAANDGDVVVES